MKQFPLVQFCEPWSEDLRLGLQICKSVALSNGPTIGHRCLLWHSVYIHLFIKPKFGVHIAVATTYLLDQSKSRSTAIGAMEPSNEVSGN